MSAIIDKRVCAEIDGPFVLFLIGIRLNRSKLHNHLQ